MHYDPDDGRTFCGVSEEHFSIAGVTYRWPAGSKLAWGLGFSRLGAMSDMDVKDAVTAALAEISGCCDVKHEFVANANRANIKIITARLDGASGVLADCQIPVGNVTVDGTQLLMRIDDSEAWGLFTNPPGDKIDFYRVVLHELLHGHGLGHKPANVDGSALIAPMYSRSVRNLQALDKSELVRRYGMAKVATTPTTPPAPVPGDKLVVEELRVSVGGKRYKLAGSVGPLQLIEE